MAVEFAGIVFANGVPAAIIEFPNNPELKGWLQVRDSPSVNVWVVLSVLAEPWYAIYKVKFPLSESADGRILSTTAVTPEVWPVMVAPTNWSAYASTGTPWKVFASCTQ